MCIKEDLGYFDKDVVLQYFLQGKKFCDFVFSFVFMISKWGEDFIGGNFPRGRGIFTGDNFLWGKF